MTLDQLRARFPRLGFAVYAMEPGGPVTFEVLGAGGEVFDFAAMTVAGALELAFPEPDAEPEAPAAPEPSIFD